MSAQQLGPRKVRRIARATGLDVIGGWSHGGYTLGFVTSDHVHGWFDLKTNEWGYEEQGYCYTSCGTRFPNQPRKTPPGSQP